MAIAGLDSELRTVINDGLELLFSWEGTRMEMMTWHAVSFQRLIPYRHQNMSLMLIGCVTGEECLNSRAYAVARRRWRGRILASDLFCGSFLTWRFLRITYFGKFDDMAGFLRVTYFLKFDDMIGFLPITYFTQVCWSGTVFHDEVFWWRHSCETFYWRGMILAWTLFITSSSLNRAANVAWFSCRTFDDIILMKILTSDSFDDVVITKTCYWRYPREALLIDIILA